MQTFLIKQKCDRVNNYTIEYTRNELASLAHSFYTRLKHLAANAHQLYSSALPWMMLDPIKVVGLMPSYIIILSKNSR